MCQHMTVILLQSQDEVPISPPPVFALSRREGYHLSKYMCGDELQPDSSTYVKSGIMGLSKFLSQFLSDALKLLILFVGLSSIQAIFPDCTYADHLQNYKDQTEQSDNSDNPENVPELKWYGVDKVNLTHLYLSSTVEKLSQRIDAFFGEDRVYEEATGSYVQARSSVILDRNGNADYDLKFRVKLKLPQLKSRFRLIIENDDDQGILSDFNRDTQGSSLAGEFERQDLAASLQYILKQTQFLNITLRPGVKLSDPVEAFMRLRLSRTMQLTERWLSRGTGEFGYYTEEGWGNDWKLEFERRLGKRDLFRSSSNARWRENSPGNWFLTQTISFTHILNPRSSIAYELGVSGETRPTLHNTSYFSNVRYRRDIHRGWLFMEVKPRVVFAKENGYDEEVSLLLTLEVLLGETYAH